MLKLPWRRVTVAEIMEATGETATPPLHKLPLVPLGGPLQRRRTTRLPAPPPRERPPDLIADETGAQLYGGRWYDRGQLAIGRLAAAEAASVRVEAPFAISSVLVHNLSTLRLAVVSGDTDPVTRDVAALPLTPDAIGFVPAGGWATLPIGGVRVIRVGTVTGAAVDGQVVVIALDRMLAPGAGLL